MTSSAVDKNCTFLISNEKSVGLQQEDICKDLESNEVSVKIRYHCKFYLGRIYVFFSSEV